MFHFPLFSFHIFPFFFFSFFPLFFFFTLIDCQPQICFVFRSSYVYSLKKKKKSETELSASVLKKRSKHARGYKECIIIGQDKTKCTNFQGNPLFQHKAFCVVDSFEKQHKAFCVVDIYEKEDFLKIKKSTFCLVLCN